MNTVKVCSDYHIMRLLRLLMRWNQREWQWFQARIVIINLQSENAYDILINNQFRRIRRNIWRAEILNDGSVTIISNFFLYVTIFRSFRGGKATCINCSRCRNDVSSCDNWWKIFHKKELWGYWWCFSRITWFFSRVDYISGVAIYRSSEFAWYPDSEVWYTKVHYATHNFPKHSGITRAIVAMWGDFYFTIWKNHSTFRMTTMHKMTPKSRTWDFLCDGSDMEYIGHLSRDLLRKALIDFLQTTNALHSLFSRRKNAYEW